MCVTALAARDLTCSSSSGGTPSNSRVPVRLVGLLAAQEP